MHTNLIQKQKIRRKQFDSLYCLNYTSYWLFSFSFMLHNSLKPKECIYIFFEIDANLENDPFLSEAQSS